jgi:hypothetical protein
MGLRAFNGGGLTVNGTTIAGVDTSIQYNDVGVQGGEAAFAYNKTTNVLTVDHISVPTAAGNYIKLPGMTVANLPAAPAAGMKAYVTNSNVASYTAGIGAIVAAGGTTVVPVFYDGTNWRIG